MDTMDGLLFGLQTALQPSVLIYCFAGVFLGTLVGVLPGIGALATISLLLPVTYHMPPTEAIVMLAGVYYGATYGGSTASILLNLPGSASSAVVCLDGYPMAQKGKAGIALFTTTIASFVGSMIGLSLLILFAPSITEIGFKFGPAEYFSIMLMGLIAASTLSMGSPAKSLAMVLLGLLLGCVGTDVNSGVARFSFDIPELTDSISLVALAMAIFGVSEVVTKVNQVRGTTVKEKITMRTMIPSRAEFKSTIMPMLRGSGVGSFFGALPGTGGSISSFMAYAVEKKVSKDPGRFGTGAIEGVAAPESANNAGCQTAFVPTLTLGIPGDSTMALMLGALMIHGIQPGPMMMSEQPEVFWGLIVSFGVGNILLLILNLPLVGLWVSILRVPYRALYPTILVLMSLGVYSVNNNVFDVYVVAALGVLGYFMNIFKFPAAPMLLGFVLGPLVEENLRRALLLSRGDMMTFIERPISASVMAVTALLMIWTIWNAIRTESKVRAARKILLKASS
ncbi:MAG: tripartite tricarboxylate transporter permease [Polaromonas sp.]|jgi:putative tricarboxylic transport membrane protein|nr:tripartite tricarboxylate transporter permease [Polaromonas sp.]